MQIQHLKTSDYATSTWSGGTTTEIFIYSRDGDGAASYAHRNFRFRVSSARVDLPESDFTALDGVVRYITPLSGDGFVLSHPSPNTSEKIIKSGKDEKGCAQVMTSEDTTTQTRVVKRITMKALDTPYRFDGAVPTHCVGTATDFNLMLKDGCDGEMVIHRVVGPSPSSSSSPVDAAHHAIPLRKGFNAIYRVPDERALLMMNDGEAPLVVIDIPFSLEATDAASIEGKKQRFELGPSETLVVFAVDEAAALSASAAGGTTVSLIVCYADL